MFSQRRRGQGNSGNGGNGCYSAAAVCVFTVIKLFSREGAKDAEKCI